MIGTRQTENTINIKTYNKNSEILEKSKKDENNHQFGDMKSEVSSLQQKIKELEKKLSKRIFKN